MLVDNMGLANGPRQFRNSGGLIFDGVRKASLKLFFTFIYSILPFIIFIVLAFGCAAHKDCKKYFTNKILVYSEQESGKDSAWNSFYIAYENDSVTIVEYPYGFSKLDFIQFDTTHNGNETRLRPVTEKVFPYSRLPFIFLKEGKQIFISYSYRNEKIKKPYYSLESKDSISIVDYKNLCSAIFGGTSKYTGNDTVIVFNQVKLNCWIFEENYRIKDFRFQSIKRRVYLEKCTFLPILRIDQYYKDPGLTIPIGLPNISKLNFIVNNNSSFYNKYHCDEKH